MKNKRVFLTDVVWFQEGPGIRNTQYTDSGVKLLNVANLVDGKVNLATSSRYISEEEAYGKYKHFLVDQGDFIIASSGIKVDYFDKKMGFVDGTQLPLCMNTSTIRFKALDSKVLNIRYFMYYLKSFAFKKQLARQITGSAQLNFGPSHLKKMTMPLCLIEEQGKICKKLDIIYNIIESRQLQLIELDNLIKSRFVEMFGDPMTNPHNLPRVILGSVLTIEPQNGLYKPQSDYVSDKTGVPILRIDGFYDGKVLNFSSLKRLICSEIELKRYSLYENDIVINRVNSIEYLGKCGLVQGLIENTVFESNMMRLHVDEHKLNPVYITKLLCSQFIYQQILKRAKKAVNQASINQKDVQSLVVYMPPIEQQEQFATFVAQIDKSKLLELKQYIN